MRRFCLLLLPASHGAHAHHGFMLHGDAGDYLTAYARETAEIKNRPAVLVIYVPR